MDLDALTDAVLRRCDVLGGLSDDPACLTRTFASPAAIEAQKQIALWMAMAGLFTGLDDAGNVHGITSLAGTTPGRHFEARSDPARRFVVGSHLDTVPNAGKYDGILGVLLAIAAAEALHGRSFATRLDVVGFSEEEGVRFRVPYLGSRGVCGTLTEAMLRTTDDAGVSVAEALRDFPDASHALGAAYRPGQVAGYLEAHIEQGPVLESRGWSLAVVTAILGQSRGQFTFHGRGGHAGTVPMHQRHDALAGAAAFISAVEAMGAATPGLRATVGRMTVLPNASNVIPSEATLSLDVRHVSDAARTHAWTLLCGAATTISETRGLSVSMIATLDQPTVAMDAGLTARLAATLERTGHPPAAIVSGAGHDAAMMAGIGPAAMLFLQSPGGVSHAPAESVRREDVRGALAVMIAFLEVELARGDPA